MSNFCEMTPQWLQNGCPKKFKLLKYEHITYSFEARNPEILNIYNVIFKFRDFMNTLRNFAKFVFPRVFAKFKYLAYINRISRSRALK